MSDDAPHRMVCSRVSWQHTPIEGSVQGRCALCNAKIWIAQAGQALLREQPQVETICVECGLPRMVTTSARAEAAPGAFDELRAVAGQEAVDSAQQLLDRIDTARRRRSN